MFVKVVFALLALAGVFAEAKPSHPFGFHGVPDHFDLVPPVLPPAHFHNIEPAPLLPYHHPGRFLPPAHFHAAPVLPAPAPLLPAPAPVIPAPAALLPAPTAFIPAHAPLIPAPAPLLPAPAPLLPAPAPLLPAPAPIFTHVLEAVPVIERLPTYRAISGPKTTTHHLSVGYAFPQPRLAHLHGHAHVHSAPHAHLHAAPVSLAHHRHHQHHTLF